MTLRPPSFAVWPFGHLGLVVNVIFRRRRREVLTVGMLRGQVLIVQTLGCLCRIPAS